MSLTQRLSGSRPRHVSNTIKPRVAFVQRRRLHPLENAFVHYRKPSPEELGPGKWRLAVKDNIADRTDDLPTTCGAAILDGYRAAADATVVTQLRARGAVSVGKTAMDAFGMGSHSVWTARPVRSFLWSSPRDETENEKTEDGSDSNSSAARSAGGSSGGSALAVARGDADVALGTDTGGSVRLPAAYTGVVGFKPSYGMLSRFGVVPYANSLDTVGLLARRVSRIQRLVVDAGLFAEHDPRDPTSLSAATRRRCTARRSGYPDIASSLSQQASSNNWSSGREGDGEGAAEPVSLAGLTFGLPLEYNIAELDPCVRSAWASAAARVQALGARVVPVSLPTTKHALSAYYVIAPAEGASNLAKYDGVRYGRRATTTNDDENWTDDPSPSLLEEPKSASSGSGSGSSVLYAATRRAGLSPENRRRVLLGNYALSSEARDNHFVQAQRVRRLVQRDFDRVFRLANPLRDDDKDYDSRNYNTNAESGSGSGGGEMFDLSDMPPDVPMESKRGPAQVDFLLCPTAPTLPPLWEDVSPAARTARGSSGGSSDTEPSLVEYTNDVFTVPASLAGLPAISIPMPVSLPPGGEKEGVPDVAGLQLIGQFWDDARLLQVAGSVARALGK